MLYFERFKLQQRKELFVLTEPCPRGMYLNETSGKCEFCPIGHYQDSEGNITCKRCPQGYSTLSTGSRHSRDCKRMSYFFWLSGSKSALSGVINRDNQIVRIFEIKYL